jgi:ferric-dicitrate binding protein FerR (iron transport regulator)
MNLPRYAVAAARLLKRHAVHAPQPAGDREQGLRTIERAMRARALRRRWLWGAGALVAAAAAFLLWQALAPTPSAGAKPIAEVSPLGRGTTLRSGGRTVPLKEPTRVGAGDTIETASDGGAALQLSSRSSLLLERATALQVQGDAQTERFALTRGAFSAHVARLTAGRRFIVDTPDAQVEVRGTQFQLRVLEERQACGSDSRTRLEVSEGVVEVRASGQVSRVTVGQVWPAGCTSIGAAAPSPSTSVVASLPHEAAPLPAGKAVNRTASQHSGVVGPSALTEQNDLFAAAMALRRQGDVALALRTYQDLISQFPSSPLAQNAMVERMRLLTSTQKSLAKEEARRYLRAYPRGFAVEEARRLTDEP